MSKRVATFQISDRNPVDLGEEEINSGFVSGSGSEAEEDQREIRQRKISKPKTRTGLNKKPAPCIGNLFAGLPTNPFASAATTKSDKEPVVSDSEYDLKIRGLNKSFVESANKLIERSPAADFTKLFQQYTRHLSSFSNLKVTPFEKIELPANKSKDVIPEISKSKTEDETSYTKTVTSTDMETEGFNITSKFNFGTNNVVEPSKSPISTFNFNFAKQEPAPAAKISEIVETKSDAPEFIFASTETKIKSEFEKNKLDEQPSFVFAPFSFGSQAKTADSSATSNFNNTFSFGSTATSETPVFSFGSKVSTTNVSAPAIEIPKSFSFGSVDTKSTFSFDTPRNTTEVNEKQMEPVNETEISTEETKFKFPVIETPKFSLPTLPSITPAEPTKFSFSSSSAVTNLNTETPKFSFAPSSIGGLAPLPSFSFGAPSTTATTLTAPMGFSFAPINKSNDQQSGGEDGSDEIPPEEAESFTLTRTNSEQMKTGAGEENETCQFEDRCKVFMWDTNSNGWIDLGIGIFKINRYNNEIGKSRVICRNEGTGKIIINTLVSVPGMEASNKDGKKEVALLAIGPDSKLTRYLIRVKTLEQAYALKNSVDSEIEYIKSSKASNTQQN